jgi:hypothetical protein
MIKTKIESFTLFSYITDKFIDFAKKRPKRIKYQRINKKALRVLQKDLIMV